MLQSGSKRKKKIHRPSHFTGTSQWPWLLGFSANTIKWSSEWHVLQTVNFTCGFNKPVLHHTAVVNYVSSCPKIILDAGLVADVKLQLLGLHTHLTWILCPFPFGDNLKISSMPVDTRDELRRRIRRLESEIKNTSWIFERLRISFSRRAVLCVRAYGRHFEHFL
jgi:hypothetical protein